jgi:hypothetical protein
MSQGNKLTQNNYKEAEAKRNNKDNLIIIPRCGNQRIHRTNSNKENKKDESDLRTHRHPFKETN